MLELLEQFKDADIKLDAQTLLAMAQEQLDIPVDIDDAMVARFETTFDEIVERAPTHNSARLRSSISCSEGS